jgi:hypothetical protein
MLDAPIVIGITLVAVAMLAYWWVEQRRPK